MKYSAITLSELSVVSYQSRIVEGLLKVAQPFFHIVVIEIVTLPPDHQSRVFLVTRPESDELADDQVFRRADYDRPAGDRFYPLSVPHHRDIKLIVSQEEVYSHTAGVFGKQETPLLERCLWRIGQDFELSREDGEQVIGLFTLQEDSQVDVFCHAWLSPHRNRQSANDDGLNAIGFEQGLRTGCALKLVLS